LSGLYLSMIGITGSILVFHEELDALFAPGAAQVRSPGTPEASLSKVLGDIQSEHPGAKVKSVIYPTDRLPAFRTTAGGKDDLLIFSDAGTGRMLGSSRAEDSWLAWTRSLHANLLMGRSGRVVNGVGAALLLLICMTGAVIWWPGARRWKRSLTVKLHAPWKRFNFYFHSATGFWSLAILLVWGLTGVYFGWPRQFTAFVAQFSPVTNGRPPKVDVPAGREQAGVDLDTALSRLAAENAGMQITRVLFPPNRRAPLTVTMGRPGETGPGSATFFYLHPVSYRLLNTWQRGKSRTAGDAIIGLTHPIHFGTSWGLAVKVFWGLFGLSLPILFTTGAIMYWNRSLARLWGRLKSPPSARRDHPVRQ
jgi:uncharacterized iron-regulated membrane protein